MISYATSLLKSIHIHTLANLKPIPSPDDLFSPKDRKTITALIDLITLEGVYPCLTPGIGPPVERRAKTIIQPSKKVAGRLQDVVELRDTAILIGAINTFIEILKDNKGEVVELVKDRCLVDVVAGCGELAFNPSSGTPEDRSQWRIRWEALIDGWVVPTLEIYPISLYPVFYFLSSYLTNLSSKLNHIPAIFSSRYCALIHF